jgi:hypothetical protein
MLDLEPQLRCRECDAREDGRVDQVGAKTDRPKLPNQIPEPAVAPVELCHASPLPQAAPD